MSPTIWFLIILAVIFNFLNGFHDSSNIVATVIFSRALPPKLTLIITAVAEFFGPFIFGVAVAKTIGGEVVTPGTITISAVFAGLLSAIIWNLLTWYLGIPSSSSHALIGGLVGAVLINAGGSAIQMGGLIKVFIALFASPVIGLMAGFLITKLIFFLVRNASPKINWFFKRAQILTSVALALSHGANDGQKTMGIIALGLVTVGYIKSFYVPTWVIFISALTMSLGVASGGTRLIKTLGQKFFKIKPVDGFATQLSSATVILGAALFGGPASTSQVVSSAIMGVGSAERVNKVRWGTAGNIILTWVLTIPATAVLGALFNIILANFPAINQIVTPK